MFNIKSFSNILQKITDTYTSISEFAEKSEVNRTYLSKYINMKLDNPPTPKILEKIANASNNIITYKQLMIMCGYLEDETENYINLSKELSKSKAYLDCYNILSSTTLSSTEINKILYHVSAMNIEESGKDEDKLKEILISLFNNFPEEHKDLVNLIFSEYWEHVLKYREEAVKFLKSTNDKDEQEFRFAYHKEMEGLTDEEILDALRFYKEMKNKINKK